MTDTHCEIPYAFQFPKLVLSGCLEATAPYLINSTSPGYSAASALAVLALPSLEIPVRASCRAKVLNEHVVAPAL